jgi:hypothetical protein
MSAVHRGRGTLRPLGARLSRADEFVARVLQLLGRPADFRGMNTMACRAVAEAGLAAATASLDDEAEWPLLLVAGWLTTAADLMSEANLRVAVRA